MGEHTKTPWHALNQHIFAGNASVPIASGHQIYATDRGGALYEQAKANAAFIVEACNSHDALVKALTSARAAIASLPMEALGYASAENDQAHWPIRDELLHNIDEALAKVSQP